MSAEALPPGAIPRQAAASKPNYLNWSYAVKDWLLTIDHKRIAVLYLVSISIMFAIGGVAAAVRLELTSPHGRILESETYNKMFTMHGVIMVFFFLVPSIPATLGNFLIPLMVGARDLAFPRLNLLSWYLLYYRRPAGAGSHALRRFAIQAGPSTRLTAASTPMGTSRSRSSAIFIAGFSSIARESTLSSPSIRCARQA